MNTEETPAEAPEQNPTETPTAETPTAETSATVTSQEATPAPAAASPDNVTASPVAASSDDSNQDAPAGEADESASRPKIAIGSQRDAADKSVNQPAAVAAALANPIELSADAEPVENVVLPDIESTDGLSDDVEAEIEAALGGISMDSVVSEVQSTKQSVDPGTKISGNVTKIHGDHVFVKMEGLAEGVAALHQFTEAPTEGATIELIVRGRSREDGLYELAVPGAAIGATDWDDLSEGDIVEAKVTAVNTGGLEASVASLKGFIPASQIDRFRVEDLNQFLEQKLTCVIIESNPDKRRLVLSRRAILERENEEKRKQLLEELDTGQIREGLVTKLMDFGAFVDLGGAEGLIHISKLSWSRVKHPSDVLQVGERVKVKVESIDLEANRISLSHRDTLEHPWENVSDDFQPNQIVKGTVTKIADFGAFVKIAHGVEGLVHISEISHKRVVKVSTHFSVGQEIDVKILSIDTSSQKISLSHKATLAAPVTKTDKKEEEPELPARDLAVPESGKPLKGGNDRKTGGESIGLKW